MISLNGRKKGDLVFVATLWSISQQTLFMLAMYCCCCCWVCLLFLVKGICSPINSFLGFDIHFCSTILMVWFPACFLQIDRYSSCRYGVLFVDNPVGTGYSIAENEQDVPRDQYTVAAHLYYGLQFFFSENPSFKKRPLVLAGESYAGKYVPSLAFYMLSKASSKDDEQLQFSGMAIGNGLTDPRIQVGLMRNFFFFPGFDMNSCKQLSFRGPRSLFSLLQACYIPA